MVSLMIEGVLTRRWTRRETRRWMRRSIRMWEWYLWRWAMDSGPECLDAESYFFNDKQKLSKK